MNHIRVGVLRGGVPPEYSVSLKTGASVLSSLPPKYTAHDIFIDKNKNWHIDGIPILPAETINRVDVFFNALHGAYGEDGELQRQLDLIGIPYTGSGAFASAHAMGKHNTRRLLEQIGVRMPHAVLVGDGADHAGTAELVFRTFSFPLIVKPVNSGSSVGVSLVNGMHELKKAFAIAAEVSKIILVEEYINGVEATCGVIENFRKESLYALPPIEIRTPGGFFDYNAKYNGETEEICPGAFSRQEKDELMNLARTVHEKLGLRHYSRSDFIVSPRGVYFLEVNTLPGLTSESLFPKSLNAVGSNLSEFLHHTVQLAMGNNKNHR